MQANCNGCARVNPAYRVSSSTISSSTARQKDGIAILANLNDWQMFNEVNGIYSTRRSNCRHLFQHWREDAVPRTHRCGNRMEQRPAAVAACHSSVPWGEPTNPLFPGALFDHTVSDPAVAQDGGLAIEAIAIHPMASALNHVIR